MGSLRGGWLAVLLVASAGCEPAAWSKSVGIRALRELPAEQARAWAEDGRGQFVQLRGSGETLPAIPGAERLRATDEIPEGLIGRPGWLVVVASDSDDALQLAARLARAGAPRVAVATGEGPELASLSRIRTAARDDAAKPAEPERHPSN